MRILIAFDGSPAAEAAVDAVAARPWPAGSEVRLVTVVQEAISVPPAAGIEVYAPLVERMRVSLRDDAYRRIQRALEKFKARPDLTMTYELRDGGVKPALLAAIRDWDADLVVAGSQGMTALGRLFLGSVCHTLVTHAPCTVEVVKTAA